VEYARVTAIEFDCDRCKRRIRGMHSKSGTAGFYVVDRGTIWAEFARKSNGPEDHPNEHFVCDDCVQSMPEYQAIYGDRRIQSA
jgi:hypothetical protein